MEIPMSETLRRRLSDKMPSSPTLIGVGTSVVGDLQCEGDLVIGGSVRGDGLVRGSFTLFETGLWQGRVQAKFAVIAGEVEGEIRVADKLEIRKSARIRGLVSARSIAVAQGAVIEGDLAVTSGAEVVRYDEKRIP
jgi:cytoskeletal protein CcmA (bactofilin family)